jgi:hypothetical protein
MLQKSDLLEARNGTKLVSNAECATRCWTQQTAPSMRESSSARFAMVASSDPKVMDLAVVPDVFPWTLELSFKARVETAAQNSSLASPHDQSDNSIAT